MERTERSDAGRMPAPNHGGAAPVRVAEGRIRFLDGQAIVGGSIGPEELTAPQDETTGGRFRQAERSRRAERFRWAAP